MAVTLPPYIEITPGVRGGRPRIAGTRITVADIVIMHLRMDESIDVIAATYNLSLASVYAALSYYFDRKAEIDADIASDEAYAEAFRRDNVSPLQGKAEGPPPWLSRSNSTSMRMSIRPSLPPCADMGSTSRPRPMLVCERAMINRTSHSHWVQAGFW
jgi:uncharacterized protein (DUF433 family)